MFFAFLIFFIIASCQTQIPDTYPCKFISRTPNFDPKKLPGLWYVFANTDIGKPIGTCGTIFYVADNENATRLIETQKIIRPGVPRVLVILGEPEYLGDAMYIAPNMTNVPLINTTVTFWNTDYTSYAIRATCKNLGQSSGYFAWILTRSQYPSPSVIAKIDEALKIDGVPMDTFTRHNQTGCPKKL